MCRGWPKPKEIWFVDVYELSKADVDVSQFRWQIVPDSGSATEKSLSLPKLFCGAARWRRAMLQHCIWLRSSGGSTRGEVCCLPSCISFVTIGWVDSNQKRIFLSVSVVVLQVNLCVLQVKKVKASHNRYWALGPELISVYRQLACCKSSIQQ